MEKGGYKFDKEIFEFLKEEYKIALNCDLKNFNDYKKLRNFINKETEQDDRVGSKGWRKESESGRKNGDKLSSDSIKRHFGYINYSGKPGPAICSLLARRLGYLGWDDFYEKATQKYDPRNTFNSFDTHKLFAMEEGDQVTIGWPSEKYCILKYLGDLSFEVVESHGLKSRPGRVIETMGFCLGQAKSRFAYPDIIIKPICDDDPDYELIELDLIPEKCLL